MRFKLTNEDELVLSQLAERVAPWVTGRAYYLTFAIGIVLAVLAAILLAAIPLRDYPLLSIVGVMLCADWCVARLARRWLGR